MKRNNSALPIAKYTGAGNDFIIVDIRRGKDISQAQRKNLARKLCDRHFGVGADGLLFIEKPKQRQNDFAWDFYNQDGSRAEMCLNASRCVVLFEFHQYKKKQICFESRIGLIRGKVLGAGVAQVQIPLKQKSNGKKVLLKAMGKTARGYLVNSGVPHFVVQKKKFEQEKEKEFASHLRKHQKLKPAGANITFWEAKKNIIRAATFERGVEDFTLSCGTGAAAVGLMFADLANQNKIQVAMPGGKILVNVLREEGKLQIQGPAKKIFSTTVSLEDIL